MELKLNPIIKHLLKYSLITLFSYSLLFKLLRYSDFTVILITSELIPDNLTKYLHYFLIMTDILILIRLILYPKKIFTFLASLFLLFIFTLYLIIVNNYNLFTGCSCVGIFPRMTFFQNVIINFIAIIFTIILIFNQKKII